MSLYNESDDRDLKNQRKVGGKKWRHAHSQHQNPNDVSESSIGTKYDDQNQGCTTSGAAPGINLLE